MALADYRRVVGDHFPKYMFLGFCQDATDLAVEALGDQTPEQLAWLGATPAGERWRLPMMGDLLEVDCAAGHAFTNGGDEVSPVGRLLALHYLAIRERPETRPPSIVFADLPGGRTYDKVYQDRVIGRLCWTAGRDRATLEAAVQAIGGTPAEGGDAAFDFAVFPRVTIRLIWHAPDEEFPSSATILLPENIERFFCVEDIVVVSECVVARLGGRSF